MVKDRRPPQETRDLRKRAEARLQLEAPGLQELSPEAIRAMLHELQVHQLELEMQNEALRESQASLEASSKRYRDFYDFSPVGFLTLDKSGLIRQINLTAANQLGVNRDRLITRAFQLFMEVDDSELFRLFLKRVFQEPGQQHCEIRLKGRDGGNFYARLDSLAVADINGSPVCHTSVTDISQLKQAERELQESQGLFTAFMRHLPSVAVIRDLEGRYLFVNPAWERAFHKTREEWLGKTTDDLWPPHVAERFRAQDRMILESGEALQTLGPLPHPDGVHHWAAYRFPIAGPDGSPVLIGITAIDVTEPMKTKARLEQLLASSPAAIYTCEAGSDFAPTYVSENIKAQVGWEPRDFLEDPRFWINHLHPEDRPRILEQLKFPWPEDHQSLEYRFLAKDGAYRWMCDEVKLMRDQDGNPVEVTGAWRDITARRLAEEALKESENQYQMLVNQIPAVIFKGYADWSIDFFDHKVEALTGYGKTEFDSRKLKWCDLILPEDLVKVRHSLIEALKGDHSYVREYRIREKDGDICWIQARGQIFCDAAGKVDFVSGVLFDITARKEAETTLQKERQRFFSLLDVLPAYV
ncbi:MAG: PAS domain S-box protein [Desulfobaccales bacterium]